MPLPVWVGSGVRSPGLTLTCPRIAAVSVLQISPNADDIRCILQSCMLFLSLSQRTWLQLNARLFSSQHKASLTLSKWAFAATCDHLVRISNRRSCSKVKLGINQPLPGPLLQRRAVEREVLYSLVSTESKVSKSPPLPLASQRISPFIQKESWCSSNSLLQKIYKSFKREESGLLSFSHHDDCGDGKEGILKPTSPRS